MFFFFFLDFILILVFVGLPGGVAALIWRSTMTEGSGQPGRADLHFDAGREESSRVALQKQIGLFSACGIIIGEFQKNAHVPWS